jgi:hypothetical protein
VSDAFAGEFEIVMQTLAKNDDVVLLDASDVKAYSGAFASGQSE